MVKVLVVDAGGRGNATAHALSRSPYVGKVYVAPGNYGSYFFEKCEVGLLEGGPIPSIRDIDKIVKFAKNVGVELAVVCPEEPLALGLVNRLEEEGILAFGPRKEAVLLEESKCWTKELQREVGVPVPDFEVFDDAKEARDYVEEFYGRERGKNLVVKADGLAAGKGVYVCNSKEDCFLAIDDLMVRKVFGDAGRRILIEERLHGVEVAFQALADGDTVLPFGAVRDYKKAYEEVNISDDVLLQMLFFNEVLRRRLFYNEDGRPLIGLEDAGNLYAEGKLLNPNTGGMGAVFPHPYVSEDVEKLIMDEVVIKTLRGFREKTGVVFKGMLYPVIMLCREDDKIVPKCLEINVRECDPGAQAKLPMLLSDFYELCSAVVNKKLHRFKEIKWKPGYSIAVCAVSGKLFGGPKGKKRVYPGYPGEHLTSQVIHGLDEVRRKHLIYANGVAKTERGYETTGGRVFTALQEGSRIEEARELLYSWIKEVKFNGMRYRMDIGLDLQLQEKF